MSFDLLQMAVLSAIAIACGLLGPLLVLKRMTMLANSLSHTVLLGIALAFFATQSSFFELSTLLLGAFFAALITAFFTGGLLRCFRLQEDASIGLVFTTLFALAIALVTLFSHQVHLGLDAVMGNADLLQKSDLWFSLSLSFINLLAIVLLYPKWQILSFDLELAQTLNIRTAPYHLLLLLLTSITCVGAFRAIGVLLVLGFLVGPFLIARLFCHRLSWLLFFTPLLGMAISILGVLLSRLSVHSFSLPLSTSGIVAILIGAIYGGAKWTVSIRAK